MIEEMRILVVGLAIYNPLHLSAPVCPPDMIFWSIIGETTGCLEEIQGV
jgi:hypothetical protein